MAKEKVFILRAACAASTSILLLIAGCGGGSGSSTSSTSTTPINKTTPTLTWATPAAVGAGTALSATQLDATASVPGAFVYTPALGTVMTTVGTQTLSVAFTPTDTTDYNSNTGSVTLTVNKGTPTINWATPSAVVAGTLLSATQLDATASVPGAFVYSPVVGTVMSTVGTQTLSTTFTPTDTADYNTATSSVSLSVTAAAAPPPSYSWSNVKIIAGGYVPAIYFHPTQKGLMYARTDMGGAYRWGPSDTQWVPLLDWISPSVWWYGGAEAIGLDPTDPNRLYIAVGEYANENWDSNGAMMVSDDQGATFTTVPLSFKNGSNDNGRNSGERIAVDPNTPATVYFGTRIAGLQLSTNHGAAWSQVTGLPVTSTANGNGIVSVVPVSVSGDTKAVYVAVGGTGVGTDPVGLYVSTNPGATTSTFTAVTGQPSFASSSDPMAPLHAVLGPNGNLYVLYADGAGPNGINLSQLWEFAPGSNWTSGTWTQITLPANTVSGYASDAGFGGISVDPNHVGVLIASTIDDWWPGDTIYRSTDNGKTWKDVGSQGGTHDASLSPWLAFGGSQFTNVGSGNWAASIPIDPFNSDHVIYGTGQTVWTTTNMTSADSGGTVNWTVGANGIEENALGLLLAPPSGNTLLLSGMGDIYGFAHTDLTKSPAQGMYTNPMYYPDSMDFEQATPTTVV
ncbi:MAG: sialidase family protein, partial [Tepidisphaeraceae bacterium]